MVTEWLSLSNFIFFYNFFQMPRKLDRTTKKCQWCLDVLNRAIQRVNNDGVFLHKAAEAFKITYFEIPQNKRILVSKEN